MKIHLPWGPPHTLASWSDDILAQAYSCGIAAGLWRLCCGFCISLGCNLLRSQCRMGSSSASSLSGCAVSGACPAECRWFGEPCRQGTSRSFGYCQSTFWSFQRCPPWICWHDPSCWWTRPAGLSNPSSGSPSTLYHIYNKQANRLVHVQCWAESGSQFLVGLQFTTVKIDSLMLGLWCLWTEDCEDLSGWLWEVGRHFPTSFEWVEEVDFQPGVQESHSFDFSHWLLMLVDPTSMELLWRKEPVPQFWIWFGPRRWRKLWKK